MALRLAFMGTPDFAVPTLAALIAAGHRIAAVYTQPPRRSGRGQKLIPSPVARFAESKGLPVYAPASLKPAAEKATFAGLDLDAAVVAAYGLILPKVILEAPRLGTYNVHASLLPRWRGAAPIQRAIMAGDAETGVTIMKITEGLDAGPMLLAERVAIGPETTAGMLHDQLSELGASLMVRALAVLELGAIMPMPQPETGVTYAPKITNEETRLDWAEPAEHLARKVRALAPQPGAWFEVDDARIRVLAARAVDKRGQAGTVLCEAPLTVACGTGALELVTLQRAGKAALEAAVFLRGFALPAGRRLS